MLHDLCVVVEEDRVDSAARSPTIVAYTRGVVDDRKQPDPPVLVLWLPLLIAGRGVVASTIHWRSLLGCPVQLRDDHAAIPAKRVGSTLSRIPLIRTSVTQARI